MEEEEEKKEEEEDKERRGPVIRYKFHVRLNISSRGRDISDPPYIIDFSNL